MSEEKRSVNIFKETMAHLTYVQIEEAAREGQIVLFPTGVIEEHGPHLPLAVDVYGSYLQSKALKKELEKKGIKSLIVPPFYWGVNVATGTFGGSFSCRKETVVSVLYDAMGSLKRWGFERVFFINHHMDGHHMQAIDKAILTARKELGIEACLLLDSLMARRLGFKGDEPHLLLHKSFLPAGPAPRYLNIHAEGYETSFIWYYSPELINLEIWKDLKPTKLTLEDLMLWSKGGAEARRLTPQGYFGDPTLADPEKGRDEIETFGKLAAEVIEAFLKESYTPPKDEV
jgi:creatinine amidohydrolase